MKDCNYEIISTDGRAKHAKFTTVHGEVHTPLFMNVATVAAIKGAVSTVDLKGNRYSGGSCQYISFTCKNRR